MPNEMVERLAKVIAYEMGDTMGDSRAVFWSGYSFKDAARKAARAAIKELIEPTEAMIEAGEETGSQGYDWACSEIVAYPEEAFQAMLRAALTDN